MTQHKDEGRTCPNCDGYGTIEGRFCVCSLGQMALSDALARGEHVAVAYNHETGKKETFIDRKHKPVPLAAAPASGEAAPCDCLIEINSEGVATTTHTDACQYNIVMEAFARAVWRWFASVSPDHAREIRDSYIQEWKDGNRF